MNFGKLCIKLLELVKKVRNKDISSKEITKTYIDRSEKSKKLNSYITEDFDEALRKAENFDKNPKFEKKLLINQDY